MTGVAEEKELYRACQIIFGPELTVSREFLEYIQLSGVKVAFRKRAMEVHPDRLTGKSELAKRRSAHRFAAVRQAYEQLATFVNARDKGFRFNTIRPWPVHQPGNGRTRRRQPPAGDSQGARAAESAARGNGPRPQTNRASVRNHHRGPIPERPLLFGHYLYYAGLVDWRTIVQALIWQRSQYQRIGEIAREKGWLKNEDIFHLLKTAKPTVPFGQRAVQLGLLTRLQLLVLLAHQKRQQKRIGEFFVQKKIFNRQQLAELLTAFHRHNSRLSRFAQRAGKR